MVSLQLHEEQDTRDHSGLFCQKTCLEFKKKVELLIITLHTLWESHQLIFFNLNFQKKCVDEKHFCLYCVIFYLQNAFFLVFLKNCNKGYLYFSGGRKTIK